ncbi:MAG: ABC transporter permease subunit [Oscillospiraceae bacterium]|nr:ABC transporter permease subunit [Oscillospiraceae bacterium]
MKKKSNILTVTKKEIARFVGDKRMIMMILLPAVMIYVMYSFMGSAFTNLFSVDDEYSPIAYTVNLPRPFIPMLEATGLEIIEASDRDVIQIKEYISKKQGELLLVFPENFIEIINDYNVQTSMVPAPNVEIYFNSSDINSAGAFNNIILILDNYEASLVNKFDINRGILNADLVTADDLSASIMSMMMPMLLLMFLYSGCASLAPESIAGEKERGTLATLLVTPLKRSELAIGKILSLGLLSLLSGFVTALATILSLPKLMGDAAEFMDTGIYNATDYLLLACVILSTVLLLVTLISIMSAFAKTVKETTAVVTPLMIVIMLIGLSGMFSSTVPDSLYFLIPLYGSVQSMSGIFSMSYSTINIALSCAGNLLLAFIGAFVLTKMFNSEKVMFSK